MYKPSKIAIVALAALALSGALAGAHARNYVRTSAPLSTCIDKDYSGLGGAVGGAVNGAIDTADPIAPDHGGTCYRPAHITPNVNGDVTFSVSDGVATTVGICVSQDGDGDGGICRDDGDLEQRTACNSVTVNVADGYDFVNKHTSVTVDRVNRASAIYILLLGDTSFCGLGIDSYGITGNLNHS